MNFFDLHCDTFTRALDSKTEPLGKEMQLSLDERGGIESWCQLFAVFIGDEIRGEEAWRAYRSYVDFIKDFTEKHSELLALCSNEADVGAALEAGKCAGILAIENAAALGGRIENLEIVARDGVRAITLTWNGENEFARGSGAGGRLKERGMELVRGMRSLNIAPDVSHLSDDGLDEALCKDDGVFIATHSNLRSQCDVPRNLTKTHFCELCRRGGLVGLNLYTRFIKEDGDPALSDFLRHAYEMLSLGGVNTLSMGSDFDGADMPAFCRGSYDIPALYDSFSKEFGEETARKIFFDNARAFFQKLMV